MVLQVIHIWFDKLLPQIFAREMLDLAFLVECM